MADGRSGVKAAAGAASGEVGAYLGSLISLISISDIRYEGFLCELNSHDSTIALSHVKSFGTEGRKKDGPDIPPLDRVYEYILFRGSDIKDLHIKLASPSKQAVAAYSDPAIIMSQQPAGNPTSQSVAVNGGLMPSNCSTNQIHLEDSPVRQTLIQSGPPSQISTPLFPDVSSFGPSSYWQDHNEDAVSINPQFQQNSRQNQTSMQTWPKLPEAYESSTIGLAKTHDYSNTAPQLPSLFENPTLPPHYVSAAENMMTHASHPATYQEARTITSPSIGVASSTAPVKLVPFITPSLLTSGNSPTLVPSSVVLAEGAHHMTPLVPNAQNLHVDQPNMGVPTSTSYAYGPSSGPTQILTAPSMQQSQHSGPLFTEEFDFEAMNEKFKKDELWGYLGRVKEQGAAADQNILGIEGRDTKPAYNKDDFFDTISRSLSRGVGNRRNNYQSHVRMNYENSYQWGSGSHHHLGYDAAYGGIHREPHNWGRGYGYDGRNYGRNQPFDST